MKIDNINEIIQLISQSPELTNVGSSYITLMTELNLIEKFVNPTLKDIINTTLQQLSAEEALGQILQIWKERFGTAANVQNLISCFENAGYVEIPTTLTEYYKSSNQKLVARKHEQVKSRTFQDAKESNRMFRACKYSKDPNRSNAETVHLLESSNSMTTDMSRKISTKRKKIWCETLRSQTRRSICKYASLLILVQVCIALSLHAQLRSLTNQILVYSWNEETENLQCPNITVSSYIEYQMKMNQLSENVCSVHVFIDLKTRKDWQLGVPLKDPEKISQLKIKGDISLGLLDSILQESKQLKGLILTHSDHGLCDTAINTNKSYVHHVVNLRNLEGITFENVTSCSTVYELIAENAHMKNLQSFEVKGGVIDKQNAKSIRDILQSHTQNLKTLNFPDTKWNTLLFGNPVPVFSYVEDIRIDFLSDTNNSLSFISSRFPEMFPNLKIFQSKRGLMPWMFFQRLLKCRYLTKAVVTVNVPTHYPKPVKMNFLNQASSVSIKHLEITFNFPNKHYTDFCEFQGIENERKRFSMLLVKANCKIRHV